MKFIDLDRIRNNNGLVAEINEIEYKDIAIIGISAHLPMAEDQDQYWDNIMNKVESIRDFPKDRKDNIDNYLKYKGIDCEQVKYLKGSYLDYIDEFDAKHFHLSPKEAKFMDPRQRLFLQHAWKVIEDAGYSTEELKGQRVGVYSGFSDLGGESYFDMLTAIDPSFVELGLSGNLQSIIPSRVSYIMDFRGPSLVVDTACSSSLVSLHLACQALRNKECDAAIVGSVRLQLIPLDEEYKIGIESSDGRTRAFDNSANGTGIGEGAIAIMIKPMEKAKADGDHIYAVIKGTAINQDGNSIGITAPNAEAQTDVVERAWQDAGIFAEEVSYIEAHGTGTLLGDPIEIDGINKAFLKYTEKKQFCAISSVKNNIGHLYDASGLASVIKCIYALNNKVIPPTINYKIPNQAVEFQNSPVYVNTKAREWKSGRDKRICGISSFGFSGTNCHIVLEEADQSEAYIETSKRDHLLVLSGKTLEILKKSITKYISKLDQIKIKDPRDVCYTAAVGRSHYHYRLAVLFQDYIELEELFHKMEETSFDQLKDERIIYRHVLSSKEMDHSEQNQLENIDLNTAVSRSLLLLIGEAYTNGKSVPWKRMYCSAKRTRVILPVSIFEQKKYWITIPEVSKGVIKYEVDKVRKLPQDINLKGKEEGKYTDTEIKVGQVIYKVLELDQLDIYENFYSYGGDSILVTNICTELKQYLQVNLTVADIYSNPSIYLLAEYIDGMSEKNIKEQTANSTSAAINESRHDIAIIGIGGRFPGSDNLDEYWQALVEGKNCVTEIPENRQDDLKNYLRHLNLDEQKVQFNKAGYLSDIAGFDYKFFGLTLKEAVLMDPVQRVFLETALETVEEAGYGGNRMAGSNTGVFLGYTEDYDYSYKRFISESDPQFNKVALAGNLSSIIASRVSYLLDLKGPSIVIDTACSSSMVAVNSAVKSLRAGECNLAIAGGVKVKLLPLYQPEGYVGVESEHFKIRAFDDQADGTVEGEAVCAVLLKPLKQAIADGDNIRAVLKGSAVNQDGTGMGITAPRADTQQKVIIDAWKDAGIDPATVTYIEAHGTGTKLGDLIEYEALKKAFERYTDEKQFCGISSGKTNFGHLFQASGVASLIKAVLSLQHKTILPLLHFERPNRLIDFENSPLYVNDLARYWNSNDIRRRCGVSSFGLSGTNSHVVLEEFIPVRNCEEAEPFSCIITISGKDKKVIIDLVKQYRWLLENTKQLRLADFSFTVTAGRGHYNERIAFLADSKQALIEKLDLLVAGDWDQKGLEGIYYGNIKEKIVCQKKFNDSIDESVEDLYKKIKGKRIYLINHQDLNKICFYYVTGAVFDWEVLYQGNFIMSLPTYPFQREKCWYQPKPKTIDFHIVDVGEVRNDFELIEEQDGPAPKAESHIEMPELANEEENAVIKAFVEVLHLSKIDQTANFFELGGDSLKATLLASKIYQYLDVLISLSDILSYPTIGDLIRFIETIKNSVTDKGTLEIPKLEKQEYYDLSLKQMDLWLSTQIYGEESALNITWASMLYDFDVRDLERSLEVLIRRHTIMRTRIILKDSIPKHIINEYVSLDSYYQYLDLSVGEVTEKIIQEMIQQEVRKQFDFENDAMVRVILAKVTENQHMLIFTISHIIADWWTMDVVIKELREIYRAFRQNETPLLPELTIDYMDYAVWHKKMTEESGELKSYWDGILQAPLPALNLLTDFERPAVKGQIGRKYLAVLDSDLILKLQDLAELNNGTMFMILLSGVYTMLYYYSAQNDIIIGTNTSGREHPQLQNQVGYFVNVLPLRVNIEGDYTFTELFRKVKETTLAALAHQDYPFTAMLENETIIRDSSRSPIFDVLVQYLNDPNDVTIIADGARMEEIPYDSFESKYDLVFNFIEKANNEVLLELEYSNLLFKQDTVERMINKLKRIMNEFSSNPSISIDKLNITEMTTGRQVIKRRKR